MYNNGYKKQNKKNYGDKDRRHLKYGTRRMMVEYPDGRRAYIEAQFFDSKTAADVLPEFRAYNNSVKLKKRNQLPYQNNKYIGNRGGNR